MAPSGQFQMPFERREDGVPQRRFLGGLNFRQVQHQRRARLDQAFAVVDHVEGGVDDRGGEAGAAGVTDVAIVEVEPARTEDLRGERELPAPIGDDRFPEKRGGPRVHFACDLLGHLHEHGVAMDRQLQVSLVIQRHGRDLAERVFAIEHPAIGAAQQRIGDVANPGFNGGARPGRGPGALDPLPLKVTWDLAAHELSLPGVADLDRRAANR